MATEPTESYWQAWIADLVRDAWRDAMRRGGVSEADARRIAEAEADRIRTLPPTKEQ
jgi:hypothetical protein